MHLPYRADPFISFEGNGWHNGVTTMNHAHHSSHVDHRGESHGTLKVASPLSPPLVPGGSFRWGSFRLSPEQLTTFRRLFEQYASSEMPFTDEDVAEMAYTVIRAVYLVSGVGDGRRVVEK